MESYQGSPTDEVYTLSPPGNYTFSNLLGLSINVVTVLFAFTILGIHQAGIHLADLLRGNFQFHGDPSVLYMSLFLLSATMLLVVQHHFQLKQEQDD